MDNRFMFRCWYTEEDGEQEMIYNAQATYDNCCHGEGSIHHTNFQELLEDKNAVVMQCTAVKDKNGKLIFEGDIVKIKDYNPLGWMRERIGVVKYLYGTHYPAFYIVTTYGDAKDFNNDMEIIGNKYQHPELLEVQDAD